MRATGLVRRIDDLGRVVLPSEIRSSIGIEPDSPIEFYTEGEAVVLKKYQLKCSFCGEENNLLEYKSKKICPSCKKELKEI